MKPHRNLYPQICSPDNLVSACHAAAKGKRLRAEVAGFLFQRDFRLRELRERLASRTYRPPPGRMMLIRDPKPRAVVITPFETRVVHHAVCDVLEPLLARGYIYDTWACLAGRGTHRAVLRLLGFMRTRRYLLQLDLHKYFLSIPRERLLEQLAKVVRDEAVLQLIRTLIDHQSGFYSQDSVLQHLGDKAFAPAPGKGLAIGHLTSQVLGNFYLNPLDHFIKRDLKVGKYSRYMDDLVLLADSRAELRRWTVQIRAYLADRLGLQLNEARIRIHPCTAKVSYLGYRVGREGLVPGSRMLERVKRRIRAVSNGPVRPHELVRLRQTLTAYRGLLVPL